MRAPFNSFLLRLSRWPRRIAALVCLLLAAAVAWSPADGRAPQRRAGSASNPVTAGLHTDQVAVPLTLATPHLADYVRVGDRIGVLSGDATAQARAGPALIADHLRVLATSSSDALSSDAPMLVVATGRDTALRLAALGSTAVLVVMDEAP